MAVRIRVVLWLCALGGVLAWRFPGEPMYEGLTLSEWLENPGYLPQARQAIIHAGTNSIPTYLKMLSAKDSQFKQTLIHELNNLPLVEIDPFTAEEQKAAAVFALCVLGPTADAVFPTLLKMLENKDCHSTIPTVLAAIRPGDKTAFQLAFRHPTPRIRYCAVSELHAYDFDKHQQIPALDFPLTEALEATKDPDSLVRHAAVQALRPYAGTEPKVRAAMKRLASDPKSPAYRTATNILSRVEFKERLLEGSNNAFADQIANLFSESQISQIRTSLEWLNPASLYSFWSLMNELTQDDCDASVPWKLAGIHQNDFRSFERARQHPNLEIRRGAYGGAWLVVVVGGTPAPVPELISALTDEDPQIRRLSVMTLGSAANTSSNVRAALEARKNDPAPKVQESIKRILSRLEQATNTTTLQK